MQSETQPDVYVNAGRSGMSVSAGGGDRAQDERLLEAIRLRCLGVGASKIGKKVGFSAAYVRASTNRVKAADQKESGECVTDSYWDRTAAGDPNYSTWGRLPVKTIPTKAEPRIVTARFGLRVMPPGKPATGPFSERAPAETPALLASLRAAAAAEMNRFQAAYLDGEGAE